MSTPIDTRVSIVEAPCRAFRNAARWNGQAHQSTTGVARASWIQALLGTSRPGHMASTTTGTVSTVATMARRLSASCGSHPVVGLTGLPSSAVPESTGGSLEGLAESAGADRRVTGGTGAG